VGENTWGIWKQCEHRGKGKGGVGTELGGRQQQRGGNHSKSHGKKQKKKKEKGTGSPFSKGVLGQDKKKLKKQDWRGIRRLKA